MINNIFAIYKPKGPTSHDMIDKLRKITGIRKIGHAGTLDPLAEGILVVGIGREATRMLSSVVKKEKEYHVIIKLGQTSSTDDEEGIKTMISEKEIKVDQVQIKEMLSTFLGEIDQLPPQFSAIKIKGQKAYQLARKGAKAELSTRKVLIKEINLINYQWPYLEIDVVCGPGVYIRSLARDIGEKLGVGGYVYSLQRKRVGEYSLAMVVEIEKILSLIKQKMI